MGLFVLVISVASSNYLDKAEVPCRGELPYSVEPVSPTATAPSSAASVNRSDFQRHYGSTGLRHPSLAYINNLFTAADFVSNLALYVPLGIALSGSSLVRAFLVGLTLSTSAEVVQLGYVGRIPSFFDIASSTCGAVVGYLAAMFWRRVTGYNPVSVRVYRPLARAAI